MRFDEETKRAAAQAVKIALAEDLGKAGDITSNAVLAPDARVRGLYEFKQPAIVAGGEAVQETCRQVSQDIKVTILKVDGRAAAAGEAAIEVEGPARAIFAAERVSLNFLGHLSGVATLTRRYVEAVEGTKAQVYDTRKTLPGLRSLQKYAVRCGGGVNHRMGLYDQVLIKDNHLAIMRGRKESLVAQLARVRHEASRDVTVEVEATTLDEVEAAAEAGADIIMLDNMPPERMAQAVEFVRSRGGRTPILEASGGVTLDNIEKIACTGVDRISVGALTHSAPAVDVSLEIK